MIDITPQTCKTGTYNELSNIEGFYIAQEKFDGHRACMHIGTEFNRIMLRGISKKTGERDEATDKVPYLRDCDLHTLTGTILDGELTLGEDSNSSKVQQILGATPDHAIEATEKFGKLTYNVFDIIYYNGKCVKDLPLIKRLKILDDIRYMFSEDMKVVPIYYIKNCKTQISIFELTQDLRYSVNTFSELLNDFWSQGKEGIILKDIYAEYEERRTSSYLKYKNIKTADLVIMGFEPPTSLYTGKLSESELQSTWKYWEHNSMGMNVPVTKARYYGWVGAMICGAYKNGKLVYVCTVSNLSDEQKKEIKENGKDSYLGKVVEVQYQNSFGKNKSLRHPRFKNFREDKPKSECLWEDIV